jgi:hypothetical protein
MAVTKDILIWLTEQRDLHGKLRDEAYATDDWATGNPHDDLCKNYYEAIREIVEARKRLEIFTEVLLKRIIIAAREATDEIRGA